MHALVYWNPRHTELIAVMSSGWVNEKCELLGTLEFDKTSEPTAVDINEFALPRMKLLGISLPDIKRPFPVRNYAKHAYWGSAWQ